jgi:hypothetical protein
MRIPRRKFLSTSVAAAGAALATSFAGPLAPYRVSTRYKNVEDVDTGLGDVRTEPKRQGVPLSIPSSVQTLSGAPLGGIGTGFIEIRADGCFHEWQIFNSGTWGKNVPSSFYSSYQEGQ